MAIGFKMIRVTENTALAARWAGKNAFSHRMVDDELRIYNVPPAKRAEFEREFLADDVVTPADRGSCNTLSID